LGKVAVSAFVMASILGSAASAHFQEILPSTDSYGADGAPLTIDLVFTHPMDRGPTMDMKKPIRFAVATGTGEVDLLGSLTAAPHDGKSAWQTAYTPAEPGAYTFFVEPQPYWEPAEEKSIIHYAKVVVDAFDWGSDWDRLVGLPVEIEPLTRPYGLWTGNLFSGIVRVKGEPYPFAEVEVEWVNDGSIAPPADAFITQIVNDPLGRGLIDSNTILLPSGDHDGF
jgi:cobalt/nickel transport protein